MATKTTSNKKYIEYNRSLNWLLITPLVAGILGGKAGVIGYTLQAVAVGCVGYLYYVQVRFLRQYSLHDRLRLQRILLLTAFIMPIIAACVGYFVGVAHFANGLYGLGVFTDAIVGLAVAATTAFVFLFIITAANARYVATNGGGNILQTLSKVAYVVGYIAVAVIAWFTYQFVYSLHDPTTE